MTKTPKSPDKKLVKDIKGATRKYYSSEEKIWIVLEIARRRLHRELCGPLPGRVMQSMIPRGVKAFSKASITNGRRTS